jgi:hypothetical protein
MGSPLSLPFMKKPQGKNGQHPPPAMAPSNENAIPASPSDDDIKLRLYRIIIERYREEIEAHEMKSVSDLKGMVQPHNEKIISIRDSILETFRPYVYDEHFLPAARMCFSYVSSFRTTAPPVSFWLEFSEMNELLAGDEIDKSILLCSLYRAIGSENAKVLTTDTKNTYVVFEFGGKHYLSDHGRKEPVESSGWQECVGFVKGKVIYSFSDKEYEDFQDQD